MLRENYIVLFSYFSLIGNYELVKSSSSIMSLLPHHNHRLISSPLGQFSVSTLQNPESDINNTLQLNKIGAKRRINSSSKNSIRNDNVDNNSDNDSTNGNFEEIDDGITNNINNNNNISHRIRKMITNTSKRDPRDISNLDKDEVGWTNINEEVDMTIPLVLSHFQDYGMTHFKLPEIEESISVPLFVTYSAGLWLYNGAVYNIQGIYRNDNAMMTYIDKAFQFRLNLLIRKLQFDYDFLIRLMGVSATGAVVGTLEDVLLSSDFSIDIRDPVIKLNNFKIVKFGDIVVQLSHNKIIQEISGFILTPITNLFRDRITTTISEDIKEQLAKVILEFSQKDELGLRKFSHDIISTLIGRPN